MLGGSGVQLISGEVTSARTRGRTLIEVGDVAADQFVLASGRYIGGGLVKSDTVREPLLDLGVFHEGKTVDGEYAARLRHMEYLSPESAFRAGLMTDDRLHPLDRSGEVAIQNLRAAGSVLGGYDYARGYGFGVPILTGWLAGRWAAAS
jgi:glycerol-3-phosphate dehydrogenase subunit B